MNNTIPYMISPNPFYPFYPQNNNLTEKQNYIAYLENKINELEKRISSIEEKLNKSNANGYQSSMYMM